MRQENIIFLCTDKNCLEYNFLSKYCLTIFNYKYLLRKLVYINSSELIYIL